MPDNTKDTLAEESTSDLRKCNARRNIIKFAFWSAYVVLVTELICRPLMALTISSVLTTVSFFSIGVLALLQRLFGFATVNGFVETTLFAQALQGVFMTITQLALLVLSPIIWLIRLQGLIYWFSARDKEWFPNNTIKAAIKIALEYLTDTKKELDENSDLEPEIQVNSEEKKNQKPKSASANDKPL